MPAPHLRVDALGVRHGSRLALEGAAFEVAAGTSLAIVGPNGAGKSTLLRAIAGLQAPVAGTVDTGGADVAMVLQTTTVDASLPVTVRDAVRMGRYATAGLLRRLGPADRAAIDTAMERLEVADLADRPFRELSGGQRQRVLVAQGVAQEAPILLLDEPVTGLDLVSKEVILQVIEQEITAGRITCLTTHDLHDARRCDQVLLLDTTQIAVGAPDDVLTEANLSRAFEGRVLSLPGGQLLVDDSHPHHHGAP